MYTRNNRGRSTHPVRGRKGGFRSGGFSKKGARKIKKLDASLFVNKAIQTIVKESDAPKPVFADMPLLDSLKRNILVRGFISATPIQAKAIPPILEGRDVIGKAQTGTGKTAAFLLPLINKALLKKEERVFIMAPTRELAMQIDQEFNEFARGFGMRSALCIGGTNMSVQKRVLSRHPNFVIGTPGRVKDLVEQKAIDLSRFGNVVLDEVDRMLDMGFIKDITFLLSQLRKERQTLFFSATLEKEARLVAKKFLSNPVTVVIESRRSAESVEQDIVRFSSKEEKVETLHEILNKQEVSKTLIFMRTKYGADKLAKDLTRRGFRADAIHGNLRQTKRQRVLKMFRDGAIDILIATDVAARGLDINDVSHVINYDAPESYEDYIHRIGRTGRGEKSGNALTFVESSFRA